MDSFKLYGNLFLLIFCLDKVHSSIIHANRNSAPAASDKKASGPSGRSMGDFKTSITALKKPADYAAIVEEAKKEKQLQEDEFVEEMEEEERPRGGTSDIRLRWNYKMTIVIDTEYSDHARDTILSAIYTLSEAMKCFEFTVVTDGSAVSRKKDHLVITKGGEGCYSVLGRTGGRQETVLSDQCNLYGTTIHEIMHVLGFFHEHVRPDRDEYVDIDWSKITTPSKKHQYNIRDNQVVYNDMYDFDSLMHYPIGKIMKPKEGMKPADTRPGQRDHLSRMDIIRLNGMYPCDEKPTEEK